MLTKRGRGLIESLLLLFLITYLSSDPIFSVASSVLLVIFALEAVKFRFAAKSLARIEISRNINPDSTTVGGVFNVNLLVKIHGSRTGAMVEFRDLIPEGLELTAGSNVLLEKMEGSQTFTTSYTVTAMEMGKKTYQGVEARVFDRLGLFFIKRNTTCASSLRIYPKIPLAYVETPGKPRPIIRLAQRGVTRRRVSSEITGIRQYAPGDDYRLIAWKAMAKSPALNPMTRELEQVKILDVAIVFWVGQTMKDGPLGKRKIDRAVEASLTLASQAIKEGYLTLFIYPDGSGLVSTSGNISSLARSITDISFKEVSEGELLNFVRTRVLNRSLVMILTDLPYPRIIELHSIQAIRLEGHYVHLMLLHTPTFFGSSESAPKGEKKTALEILNTIEENHVSRFVVDCSRLGIHAHICDPYDISMKMMEIFSEASRMPLP